MSKMSELDQLIRDAYYTGEQTAEEVAATYSIPLAIVEEIWNDLEEADFDYEYDGYEYDGQPDEAQEWNDFDPDC